MKKLAAYGAAASIVLLTAGPAALAQNYNPSYGQIRTTDRIRATDRIPTRGKESSTGTGAAQTGTGAECRNRGWRQGGWDQGRGSWGQGSGSSQQNGSQQSGSLRAACGIGT